MEFVAMGFNGLLISTTCNRPGAPLVFCAAIARYASLQQPQSRAPGSQAQTAKQRSSAPNAGITTDSDAAGSW